MTTRDAQLVTTIGGVLYQAQLLSTNEARRLLAEWSETPLEELPTVASELLGHCAGLPLAVAICGAMIRDGQTWSDVVSDLRAAELEFVRHDLPAYPHESVWKAIKIGIDVLGDVKFGGRLDYRERFAELAIFSPDEPFTESAVVTLWPTQAA